MFKNWKINLLVFFCSFFIYFFYFNEILISPNSFLTSIDGDSIKNYYTYIFHIKNDQSLLNFSGLNFPFGEHFIYTDCQPIITIILRALPFTHDHLIGILHYLILFSFIITPTILYNVFKFLKIDSFTSFFISISISLLSPQIWRIEGHFALAYCFVIPLYILFLLYFLKYNNIKIAVVLFFYNVTIFFLHPYIGFGLSVFSFFSVLIYRSFYFTKKNIFKDFKLLIIISLFPIIIFKLFLLATDLHENRSIHPYGGDIEIASISSVFVPNFGPFQNILKTIISNSPQRFEGLAYVGVISIILSLILILIIPFNLKQIIIRKDVFSLFIAALILLFFSFGYHNKIFNILNIQTSVFNQFRNLGRFAWYFYYMFPIFIIITLYNFMKLKLKKFIPIIYAITLIYFFVSIIEAHSLFSMVTINKWKNRNIFSSKLLKPSEKKLIEKLKITKPQAIIPIPLYHIGSEMYDRVGSIYGMLPSMLYSFHSNIPILSNMLSRTSISETENLINVLNSYKNKLVIDNYINEKLFFVIMGNEKKLPDENRLVKAVDFFTTIDSFSFGYISPKKLKERKLDKNIYNIKRNLVTTNDSNDLIYLPWLNRKPFLESNMLNYEQIYVLDSNHIKSGNYIVSFHYYYTAKILKSVFCNLIITKTNNKNYLWKYNIPIRIFSGFYKGYSLFEYNIEIFNNSKYEFIIKGDENKSYKISDFMLRPKDKSVIVIPLNSDTLFNNFSTH